MEKLIRWLKISRGSCLAKMKLKIPFGLAGASIGMGILGEQFNSEGLKQGGEVTGKFISPAINISMGGYLIKQLKKLRK